MKTQFHLPALKPIKMNICAEYKSRFSLYDKVRFCLFNDEKAKRFQKSYIFGKN